jgi:hypothetical protein
MLMDVTQALRDAENSLRDFIGATLSESLGPDWIDKCGVPPKRIERWKGWKADEEKRQATGAVEERLIYYASFSDLAPILKTHWKGTFSEAFGDLKTMEVFLAELGKLRDPDAHRRELMPHQKLLVIGLATEIRTRITRYRSKKETAADYFPRIESARDSLGNIWTAESRGIYCSTKMILRPGDFLEFVITATDPDGGPLLYSLYGDDSLGRGNKWQESNELTKKIVNRNIGRNYGITLAIKSNKTYHALNDCDDFLPFNYTVLPNPTDIKIEEQPPAIPEAEYNSLAGIPLS